MTAPRLTEAEVTETLTQVVNDFGPDHIYPGTADDPAATCQYERYDPDQDTAYRCIVGEVLHRLYDTDRWIMVVDNHNDSDVETLCSDGALNVDDHVLGALHRAQRDQDSGKTWGEALETYHEVLSWDDGRLE